MTETETSPRVTSGPKGSFVAWIAVATPLIVAVGVALFFFLTWWLSRSGLSEAARAQSLEYYDVARSVVVLLGIAGAGVGLVVAWRRQTVQEHQLRLADHDLKLRESIEKTRRDEQQLIESLRQRERRDDLEIARLHDLQSRYVEAASQLGHESAAIRLAGAYALGRLASEWSDLSQRQSCVDVLCGYLRMPARVLASGAPDFDDEEVRSSIVRLIAARLKLGSDLYWGGVGIDLSRAVLDATDFSAIQVEGASAFVSTQFQGDANFASATFQSECDFSDSIFEGSVSFERVRFERDTSFVNSEIRQEAIFTTAIFDAKAIFFGVRFDKSVVFSSATFRNGAVFDQCRFLGLTRFQGAIFRKDARFGGAKFNDDALFGKSVFTRGAAFGEAEFLGEARFDHIQVTGRVGLSGVTATKSVSLRNADLAGGLKMTGASIQGDVILDHARILLQWHLDNSIFHGHFGVAKVNSNVRPRLNGTQFLVEPKWDVYE